MAHDASEGRLGLIGLVFGFGSLDLDQNPILGMVQKTLDQKPKTSLFITRHLQKRLDQNLTPQLLLKAWLLAVVPRRDRV